MSTISKENYHAPDMDVLLIQPSGIIAASDGISDTYFGADGEPGKINDVFDGGSF